MAPDWEKNIDGSIRIQKNASSSSLGGEAMLTLAHFEAEAEIPAPRNVGAKTAAEQQHRPAQERRHRTPTAPDRVQPACHHHLRTSEAAAETTRRAQLIRRTTVTVSGGTSGRWPAPLGSTPPVVASWHPSLFLLLPCHILPSCF